TSIKQHLRCRRRPQECSPIALGGLQAIHNATRSRIHPLVLRPVHDGCFAYCDPERLAPNGSRYSEDNFMNPCARNTRIEQSQGLFSRPILPFFPNLGGENVTGGQSRLTALVAKSYSS